MKTIYFDCYAGASGDMIAGVFLDLGLDFESVKAELSKIPIGGYEIKHTKTNKNGFLATRFEVYVENSVLADSEYHEVGGQLQEAPGAHPAHLHSHEHHRSLGEIISIVQQSKLKPKIKENIERVFLRLGQAEATVHGTSLREVHLHEVGSIDAIIDISTSVIGFEWLQAEEVVISPIHLGTGFISASHGMLPVPAPATAELIKGMPVYTTSVKGELLTPTGAAILSTFATGFSSLPKMTIEKIGYGAGKRDREFPNMLRAYVGEIIAEGSSYTRDPSPEQHQASIQPGGYHESEGLILVANIDDMNPQLFGNLMEKLLDAGVMDITFTPIYMKKNRPATAIEVMISPEKKEEILSIIFTESTTIGVRSYPVKKHMLRREILKIDTDFGPVRIKYSRLAERIVNIQPEYEDCVRISEIYRIPVKEVVLRSLKFSTLTYVGIPRVGK